jgi:hypothetical protein
MFSMAIADRAAFQNSLRRMLDLPFERFIPAHGEIITERAKEKVAHALRKFAN